MASADGLPTNKQHGPGEENGREQEIPKNRWILCAAGKPGSLTARSPRASYLAAQAISTAFLALVFGSMFVVWQVGQTYLSAGLPGLASLVAIGLLVALNQPAFTLVLLALWAFPLAAGLWRGPASPSNSSWLFLEQSQAATSFPDRLAAASHSPQQRNLALRLGLLAGAIFSILHILIRLAWHYSSPPAGASNESKLALYYSQVLLAVLIQMVVVGVAAARIRRLPLLHGLMTAFVGACIMATVFLVSNLAFGGTIDLTFASNIFQTIVNAGALASLPAGLLIAAFRKRADRRRHLDGHNEAAVAA